MNKIHLTVNEAAHWLNVNPKTIQRLLKQGELPGFKADGQWRIDQEKLNDWLSHRVLMECNAKK